MSIKLSQSELWELLHYDPETGHLYWKERHAGMFEDSLIPERDAKTWNKNFAGKRALSANVGGYGGGAIWGQPLRSHRVIWKMMTGNEPKIIDHINGVKTDNRWVNLRNVDRKINSRNQAICKTNSSGFSGVNWSRQKGRWHARIKVNYRDLNLGFFDDFESAKRARIAANKKYGFHENHGRRRAGK